jgi:hypothetical protein
MSFGGGSTTTTQKLDPTIAPFVKFALNEGKGSYLDRKGNYPTYGGDLVAGFTPDTQDYFTGVRGLTAGTGEVDEATGMVRNAYGNYANAPNYQGAQFDPRRVSAADIEEYMNPFQRQAIDAATGGISRRQGEEAAALRTRQAGAGALGGSRGAIETELQNREYRQLAADTEAKMLSEGYDKATAMATGQQAAAQQADRDTEQSRQFAENAAGQKAEYGLLAGDKLANLGQMARDMETQRLDALRGIGAQQQALTQTELDTLYKQYVEGRDWDKNELADYAAIAYGAPRGSVTTQSQSSSPLSSVLGTALYGVGSLGQNTVGGNFLSNLFGIK